ncbi:MAG: PAS domain-containing protein [Candidatus Paceibacterota bacterium]|jgi:PAS domain-containing protein
MKTNKKDLGQIIKPIEAELVERLWEKSWVYIKTVVDVVREPILILDKDLRVMTANDSFFRTFQVEVKDTEGKTIYELGNGQWNIPALRKLLEDILPRNTFFKGFEVDHAFPFIGHKVMLLNAREIHFKEDTISEKFPPIILLAMEDVTEIMLIAETLASHAKNVETKLTERTQKLEIHILKLKKEISALKDKSKK